MNLLFVVAIIAVLAVLCYYVVKRFFGFQIGVLEWLNNPFGR
jgi:hypothetical protein